MSNSSGEAIENTSYTPYGLAFEGAEQSRFSYEGQEFSSVTSDYDFHFRKYKTEWGIFTQPDTLLPNVYDPQQLNRYAFERGNPYGFMDPDGNQGVSFKSQNIGFNDQLKKAEEFFNDFVNAYDANPASDPINAGVREFNIDLGFKIIEYTWRVMTGRESDRDRINELGHEIIEGLAKIAAGKAVPAPKGTLSKLGTKIGSYFHNLETGESLSTGAINYLQQQGSNLATTISNYFSRFNSNRGNDVGNLLSHTSSGQVQVGGIVYYVNPATGATTWRPAGHPDIPSTSTSNTGTSTTSSSTSSDDDE